MLFGHCIPYDLFNTIKGLAIAMNNIHEADNLEKILHTFKSYNCDEETLLTKEQLGNILEKQTQNRLHRSFNPAILKEIWGQAETNSKGQSTMRTFAKIINNAINILESRIYKLTNIEGGIPHYMDELNLKNNRLGQLQAEYETGLLENYEKINIERKNKAILQNKIRELQRQQKAFDKDLEELKSCIDMPFRFDNIQNTQILNEPEYVEPVTIRDERKPNQNLLTLFQINLVAILLQLLILPFKSSFLAILCYCMIMYWLFLGYYDRLFISFVIGALGTSLIFDFIYILLGLTHSVGTNRPQSQSGWIVMSIIVLLIEFVLRVIMIIKLMPFREPSKKVEYFELYGTEIELHKRAGKREFLYGSE